MRRIRKIMLILTILMASVTVMAQTAEPVIGIVNRTNCGIFWRLDFNYETVDADGETPVVLSAAIFMTNSIYNKNQKAKGSPAFSEIPAPSSVHIHASEAP